MSPSFASRSMDCSVCSEPEAKRAKASKTSTLYLVRHGDRWDYANPKSWESMTKAHGFEQRDPPLSALGHEQARCVAKALKDVELDCILSSPYMRTIQTAQPLAHATGLPICIEDGLAEGFHAPGSLPTPAQRFPYFPEVDVSYSQLHTITPESRSVDDQTRPREDTPDYMRRIVLMSQLLPQRFLGKSIVCFSHAASVSLVAALTGNSLFETGTFAPAGIFKLVSLDGCSWEIESHGSDNSGHVTRNNPGTFPWGFAHLKEVQGSTDEVTKANIDSLLPKARESLAKSASP